MEIKDIEKLAELAKIELKEEEKKSLVKDLDSILGYVKQITEANVPEIEPPARNASSIADAGGEYENRNIWREDEVVRQDLTTNELIIKQFPDSKDGFVKVKKIL